MQADSLEIHINVMNHILSFLLFHIKHCKLVLNCFSSRTYCQTILQIFNQIRSMCRGVQGPLSRVASTRVEISALSHTRSRQKNHRLRSFRIFNLCTSLLVDTIKLICQDIYERTNPRFRVEVFSDNCVLSVEHKRAKKISRMCADTRR